MFTRVQCSDSGTRDALQQTKIKFQFEFPQISSVNGIVLSEIFGKKTTSLLRLGIPYFFKEILPWIFAPFDIAPKYTEFSFEWFSLS